MKYENSKTVEKQRRKAKGPKGASQRQPVAVNLL